MRNKRTLVCLCLLYTSFFSAYKAYESLLSNILSFYHRPSLGAVSLCLAYFTYSVLSLAQPYFASKLQFKTLLVLGGSCFAFYVLTGLIATVNQEVEDWQVALLLLGSVCKGCGGGLLWLGQAGYVKLLCAQGQEYKVNSLFWTMLQSSYLIGNGVGVLLVQRSGHFFLVIMFAVIACSVGGFACLGNPQEQAQLFDINQEGVLHKVGGLFEGICSTLGLLGTDKVRRVGPIFLMSGLIVGSTGAFVSLAMAFGARIDLAKLDEDSARRLNSLTEIAMAGYGLATLVAGLVIYRILNQRNVYYLAYATQTWTVVALAVVLLGYDQLPVTLLGCAALGVSDTFNNVLSSVITQREFPNRIEGYALYRSLSPLGAGLIYFAQVLVHKNIFKVAAVLGGTAATAGLNLLL